MEILDKSKGK